jgi:hypothetical protein
VIFKFQDRFYAVIGFASKRDTKGMHHTYTMNLLKSEYEIARAYGNAFRGRPIIKDLLTNESIRVNLTVPEELDKDLKDYFSGKGEPGVFRIVQQGGEVIGNVLPFSKIFRDKVER